MVYNINRQKGRFPMKLKMFLREWPVTVGVLLGLVSVATVAATYHISERLYERTFGVVLFVLFVTAFTQFIEGERSYDSHLQIWRTHLSGGEKWMRDAGAGYFFTTVLVTAAIAAIHG
jgi:hypothetical protein